MGKTVLLTGTSTGIGMESALYFAERGWNVVATMRNPENRETELHGREDLDLAHLDVTDINSIRSAIKFALAKYKSIDVLVNNAGYAVCGVFEGSTPDQADRQFDTNVLGLMDITREMLPIFRKQNHGVIINVASVGGRTTVPLFSLYNSTKWAVEGFSEGLHYELRPLNIKVKIIEPGLILTPFYETGMDFTRGEGLGDYEEFERRVKSRMDKSVHRGSHPKVVARTIYKAATSRSWKLRYSTGSMSKLVFSLRKILPDRLFHFIIRTATAGGK